MPLGHWNVLIFVFANVSYETLILEGLFGSFCKCLARNAPFGSFRCPFLRMSRRKRSFWKVSLSVFANVSHETLLLEDFGVRFCECLVRNAHFGRSLCQFLRMSRTKRSCCKVSLSVFANVSHETLLTVSVFAALREDGSVVCWGEPELGGDSTGVQGKLKEVKEIHATRGGFAGLLQDGTVVTWGDPCHLRVDGSAVQDELKDVQEIHSSGNAFAALLTSRRVVTWGHDDYGGDSSSVQNQLQNVQALGACGDGFTAILADGSTVSWSSPHAQYPTFDQTIDRMHKSLKDVRQLCA